jgi:hypothetical protein
VKKYTQKNKFKGNNKWIYKKKENKKEINTQKIKN